MKMIKISFEIILRKHNGGIYYNVFVYENNEIIGLEQIL